MMQLFQWGLNNTPLVDKGVAAYALQHQNEFLWSGPPTTMAPKLLFEDKIGLLPRHLLDKKGMWHSYSGWFSEGKELAFGEHLVNINIAFISREVKGRDGGVAQIAVSLKCTCQGRTEAPKDPIALFDALHVEHEKLLGSLLTDPIKQKIKLSQG
jgi:hypothetical protein